MDVAVTLKCLYLLAFMRSFVVMPRTAIYGGHIKHSHQTTKTVPNPSEPTQFLQVNMQTKTDSQDLNKGLWKCNLGRQLSCFCNRSGLERVLPGRAGT